MNIMQATKGDGGTAWEVSQSKVMVLSLPQRSPPPSPPHYAPKRRCGAMTRPHPSLSRPPLCNISSWEGNRGAPSRWQGKSGYGLGEQGIRSVGRVGTSGHVSRSLLEPLLSADTSISSDQQASDTHGPALPNTTPDASRNCSSSANFKWHSFGRKSGCRHTRSRRRNPRPYVTKRRTPR